MNPISDTAFYCCGIRMRDAQSDHPICGDIYAEYFMDRRGLEILQQFGGEQRANVSTVSRHRYIDDYLREKLAINPKLRVIIIGCGFDSRAFRLTGGDWIELDEPQVITYKNEKLPIAGCRNQLQRIAIDFANESLANKLSPLMSDKPTLFIIEGVSMYLSATVLEDMLSKLKHLFGNHEVVADLMTRHFLEHYSASTKRIIEQMGAMLIPQEDPAKPFAHAGYKELRRQSIVLLALKYRGLGLLGFWPWLVSPKLVNGYTVRVFS